MTQSKIDLNPYNHRAGVQGFLDYYHIQPQKPSKDYLVEILTHYAGLPYENLSKIVKLAQDYTAPQRIRLPEEVMDQHARFRLGGTCFSLTYFLQAILADQNFLCYPVIAHMQRMRDSHCALIVLFNEQHYLVDPGYLLNQPMEVHPDRQRIYRTPHTGVELVFHPADEHYHVYTFNREQLKFRYAFQDKPLEMPEFLEHWHRSFYWSGMRDICLTQVNDEGMVFVNGTFVQVQNLQGKQKGQVSDIHRLVQETFEIPPEWIDNARAALPKIIQLGQEHGYYRIRSEDEK